MIPIQPQNEKKALEVLVSTFKTIPGALWVIKKTGDQNRRLKVLCRHCLKVAIHKNGAYISSDKKGVALLFNSKARVGLLRWLFLYIELGTFCIGWDRAFSMIKRESRIIGKRPKREHLYFWMIAVEDHKNGLATILEIRDFAFGLSRDLKLPILAETTVERNLNLYRRYGFKIYDEWDTGQDEIKVWFLIRDWSS